jgi:hypothetical protein
MALTVYGVNEAITGAIAKMKFVGLFGFTTSGGEPKFAATSGTAIGATLINMTGAKAKGFTNGKIVMIRKLTASVTGLVAERPYYIVGEVTNGFELALKEGGTAVKVAGAELTTTSEFIVLTELTGGSYTRVAATWGAVAEGEVADTAAEVIKVPAGFTVTDAGWWEKITAGSGATGVYAVVKLEVPEPYGAEGEYKVTADKLERSPLVG